MKRKQGLFAAVLLLILMLPVTVYAKDDGKIHEGIYVDDMSISGMSGQQAKAMIENYIDELASKNVELEAVGGNKVWVTAGELGIRWKNPEIIDEAVSLGRTGNIVRRFKELKDLEKEGKKYELELGFDRKDIKSVIEEKCAVYDIKPADASLKREGGKFIVSEGQSGETVDPDASVSLVKTYMEKLWNRDDEGNVKLMVVSKEPEHSAVELAQVRDVLGTYTTSFSSSGSGRSANVRNGCSHVNGRILFPGEQLSIYDCVSPFTEENGYYLAGSYNNGLVVETLGGGICQVSSTLYNAVIRAELRVDERSNHSMVVSYVDLSADAAISGTSKDFKFTNTTEYPIYIAGSTDDNKNITFTIYGRETREEGRTLSFETETISETQPEGDKIIADPSQPVGYIVSQSAHTGYSANYWKIVKVNGEEVERVKLNSSYYQAVPRTVTFGVAGDASGLMSAAIATGSVEHCRNVAEGLVNAANAASIAAAEAQAQNAAEEAVD